MTRTRRAVRGGGDWTLCLLSGNTGRRQAGDGATADWVRAHMSLGESEFRAALLRSGSHRIDPAICIAVSDRPVLLGRTKSTPAPAASHGAHFAHIGQECVSRRHALLVPRASRGGGGAPQLRVADCGSMNGTWLSRHCGCGSCHCRLRTRRLAGGCLRRVRHGDVLSLGLLEMPGCDGLGCSTTELRMPSSAVVGVFLRNSARKRQGVADAALEA
jgi:hypothetical protein